MAVPVAMRSTTGSGPGTVVLTRAPLSASATPLMSWPASRDEPLLLAIDLVHRALRSTELLLIFGQDLLEFGLTLRSFLGELLAFLLRLLPLPLVSLRVGHGLCQGTLLFVLTSLLRLLPLRLESPLLGFGDACGVFSRARRRFTYDFLLGLAGFLRLLLLRRESLLLGFGDARGVLGRARRLFACDFLLGLARVRRAAPCLFEWVCPDLVDGLALSVTWCCVYLEDRLWELWETCGARFPRDLWSHYLRP